MNLLFKIDCMQCHFVLSVVMMILILGILYSTSETYGSLLPTNSKIDVNTQSNAYFSGQLVNITGTTPPNIDVNISVIDPSEKTIKEYSVTSNNQGIFSEIFEIPELAQPGTWKIKASSEPNFALIEFSVINDFKHLLKLTPKEIPEPIKIPFENSDIVLIGKIVSAENTGSENKTRYGMSVEKYLKDPKSFSMISAKSDTVQSKNNRIFTEVHFFNEPSFGVGDTIFAYLKKRNNENIYSMSQYSFTLLKNEARGGPPTDIYPILEKSEYKYGDEITLGGIVKKSYLYFESLQGHDIDFFITVYNPEGNLYLSDKIKIGLDGQFRYSFTPKGKLALGGQYSFSIGSNSRSFGGAFLLDVMTPNASPLKQFRSGFQINEIKCRESLVLIQRYDGSPSCVKAETRQNLIARGWTNNQHSSDYLDIQSIEGRFVNLNPQGTCASITLERMSQEEATQIQSQGKTTEFFELDENDLEEMPVLDELIKATHQIEFPVNDDVQRELDLKELVNYEFFIMNKSIAKYGDTKEDYLMKFDTDLDARLADPQKQGFSNEFNPPQIVYDDKVYVLGGTVFWTSYEHVPYPLSTHLKDELNKDERFVILSDEDLKSVPKLKEMIDEIGTKFESVYTSKGVPENPDWNNYREWFEQKKDVFDPKTTYVPGFIYKNEYYSLGFPIC